MRDGEMERGEEREREREIKVSGELQGQHQNDSVLFKMKGKLRIKREV